MSETPHTPRTDVIRSETTAGRWSLTKKGGLLEHLEVFETELNAANAENEAMREALKEAHDTFISLQEYWNRDQNDVAMANACWHTVNTSAEALARLQPFIKP